jgi:integral membrane protein (TIGR01906 family)
MSPTLGIASFAVGAATALLLMALAIAPFLTPQWVAFEQDRADAAAWTGFTPADLRSATDAILADLVLGPPDFDVAVNGAPVLSEAERSHMRDVRLVFAGFYAAATVGLVVVIAGGVAARASRSWTRIRFWRAVRGGAVVTAAGIAVAGVIAAVAFDAAFEVFHRLFFAAGTYNFDPRTARLVQLFPDAFWSETSIAVGAVIFALGIATIVVATRRLRSAADSGIVAGALSPVAR